MRRRCETLTTMKQTLLALPILLLSCQAGLRAAGVDFVRDVRPIFEKHCNGCHGATKQKSGLRLDVKSDAMKGGDAYGLAIVPGKAADSPLIQFVSGESDDLRMPPKGDRLSTAEIATLTNWINAGASWPDGLEQEESGGRRDHWAFQPVTDPDSPNPVEKSWARNAIDGFILGAAGKGAIAACSRGGSGGVVAAGDTRPDRIASLARASRGLR